MKALVAHPPKKDSVELVDVPAPKPGPGQVLLSIRLIGIDGTDEDISKGTYGSKPLGEDYLIIGHEALGKVVELGEGVTSVSIGDVVVPTVRRPCPENCSNCRKGETDRCNTGDYREHGISWLHGFAAEYAVTDADHLVRIPKEIEDVAVLLEPLSVAENAITEIFRIQQRMKWGPSKALVMGAGPLGLLASMVLRLRGMEVHTAATRREDSLKADIVRQMGGRYINVRETPLPTSKEKYDIIMEATGSVDAAISALPLVGRNGITCILGIYGEKSVCDKFGSILTGMVLENHLIFGSASSRPEDFEQGIVDMKRLIDRSGGMLSRLITSQIEPEEYGKAFEPDSEAIKTVIRFTP